MPLKSICAILAVGGLFALAWYGSRTAFRRMNESDVIVPTVEQIRDEDSLAVFHVGAVKFIPIEWNIDTDRLTYQYETAVAEAAALFAVADEAATRAGWATREQSTEMRTYARVVRGNAVENVEQLVSLAFSPTFRLVTVVSYRGRWIPLTPSPRA